MVVNVMFRFVALALMLLQLSCGGDQIQAKRFRLIVVDSNYSMAYARRFEVNNDSLIVMFIRELENETDSCLIRRPLSYQERDSLSSFVSVLILDELKESYTDSLTDDGVQIQFKLEIGERSKSIAVSNSTESHLSRLVEIINRMLPSSYAITRI